VHFPYFHEAAPDEVTAHLRSCDLDWHDLVEWSRMRRALAIADTRTVVASHQRAQEEPTPDLSPDKIKRSRVGGTHCCAPPP